MKTYYHRIEWCINRFMWLSASCTQLPRYPWLARRCIKACRYSYNPKKTCKIILENKIIRPVIDRKCVIRFFRVSSFMVRALGIEALNILGLHHTRGTIRTIITSVMRKHRAWRPVGTAIQFAVSWCRRRFDLLAYSVKIHILKILGASARFQFQRRRPDLLVLDA